MTRQLAPQPLREFRTWLMLFVALMPAAVAITAAAWFQNERADATSYAKESAASAYASHQLFNSVGAALGTDATIRAAALPGASPTMVRAAIEDAEAGAIVIREASRVVTNSIHLLDHALDEESAEELASQSRVLHAGATHALSTYEPGTPANPILEATVDIVRSTGSGQIVPIRLRGAQEATDLYAAFAASVRFYERIDDAREELLMALTEDDPAAVAESLKRTASRQATWERLVYARRAAQKWDATPSAVEAALGAPPTADIDPFSVIAQSYELPLSLQARNELLLDIRRLDHAIVADAGHSFDRYEDAAQVHAVSLAGATTGQKLIIAVMGACSVFLGWLTVTEIRRRLQVEQAHTQAVLRLEDRADRDPLTSIWNRRRIERTLPDLLVDAAASDQIVLLAYIDLDSFKAINDVWGHRTGDTVLVTVSERLENFRFEDVTFETCRFGGDEFVMHAMTDGRSIEWLDRLGREIISVVGAEISIDDQLHQVYASAGITASTADSTIQSLLLEADSCLILAKNDRGRALVYDRTKSRTGELVYALPEALEAGEVQAHIQPVVDVARGEIMYVEALARWNRPSGEQVSPGEFIPIVESYGLAEALTNSITRSVRSIIEDPATPPHVRVWINLSPRELDVANFAERLLRLFESLNIDPSRIGIEITETAAINDHARLATGLHTLRNAGVESAIDDFGSGYSPLGYLRHLPITNLKIDRSLISGIDSNLGNQHMVRGIVGLAADLNIEITAEGIERAAEMGWLADHGVTRMQGFLFARPESPVGFDWTMPDVVIDVRDNDANAPAATSDDAVLAKS